MKSLAPMSWCAAFVISLLAASACRTTPETDDQRSDAPTPAQTTDQQQVSDGGEGAGRPVGSGGFRLTGSTCRTVTDDEEFWTLRELVNQGLVVSPTVTSMLDFVTGLFPSNCEEGGIGYQLCTQHHSASSCNLQGSLGYGMCTTRYSPGSCNTQGSLGYGLCTQEYSPGSCNVNSSVGYGICTMNYSPGSCNTQGSLGYGLCTQSYSPGSCNTSASTGYGLCTRSYSPGSCNTTGSMGYGLCTTKYSPGSCSTAGTMGYGMCTQKYSPGSCSTTGSISYGWCTQTNSPGSCASGGGDGQCQNIAEFDPLNDPDIQALRQARQQGATLPVKVTELLDRLTSLDAAYGRCATDASAGYSMCASQHSAGYCNAGNASIGYGLCTLANSPGYCNTQASLGYGLCAQANSPGYCATTGSLGYGLCSEQNSPGYCSTSGSFGYGICAGTNAPGYCNTSGTAGYGICSLANSPGYCNSTSSVGYGLCAQTNSPGSCNTTGSVGYGICSQHHTPSSCSTSGSLSYGLCTITSTPSACASGTPSSPPQPTNFTATSRSTDSLTLGWTSGGGTTTRFLLTQSSGTTPPSSCSGGQQVAGSSNSFTVTGLSPFTKYSFRLCAVDGAGRTSSGVTLTVSTLALSAPQPANLEVTATSATTITLRWTSGGGSTAGFVVASGTGAVPGSCGSSPGVGNRNAGLVTSFTVTGLTASTTYGMRLCAYNGDNVIAGPGVTVTATTSPPPPPNPTALTVAGTTDSSITLGWASGGGTTAGFRVARSTNSTPPSSCAGGADTGTDANFTATGLSGNTTYGFRVCSVDVSGQLSAGVTLQAKTRAPPPPDPRNLKMTALSSSKISISWSSGGGGRPQSTKSR